MWLLLAASTGLLSAEAGTIAAYTYSSTGGPGVPTLATKVPTEVTDVFLKAIDIAPDGSVLPKLADGRFYPHAWTATPAPRFVAMINAAPTIDWTTANPASSLTSALTSNQWTRDYTGGITVDAEFSANIETFPQHWIDAMSGLRSLANSAGQNFSLYLSPKYLDSSRYQSAATNLDSLAGILGTPPSGVANAVLFPTYADRQTTIAATTLDAAAAAVAGRGLTHRWIYDLSQSESLFGEAMQLAAQADAHASAAAGPPVVYAYENNQPVTATMTANFDALTETLAVPEPTTAWLLAAGLASAMLGVSRGKKRPHRAPGRDAELLPVGVRRMRRCEGQAVSPVSLSSVSLAEGFNHVHWHAAARRPARVGGNQRQNRLEGGARGRGGRGDDGHGHAEGRGGEPP